MFGAKKKWLVLSMMLMLVVPLIPASPSAAQGVSRTFPETGKTVRNKFLAYWENHGGLIQQGFPISDEIQERSDTDGKIYTVQYFERAAFELHPENPAPNDVLLSLLGNFLYQQKYGGNAPGQVVNNNASRLFTQTGHRVGGIFLQYWNTHGGLAQQGFPISEEFSEVSPLDGKTYRVQYFERAVFEFHPEQQSAFQVLLSQLGKFRYQAKYAAGNNPTPRPSGGNPTPPPSSKSPTPPPSGGVQTACGNLPNNINAESDKKQIRAGETIRFAAGGFFSAEAISFWFTLPTGDVVGTASPLTPKDVEDTDIEVVPNDAGILGPLTFGTTDRFGAFPGIWAITFNGAESDNTSVAYFCVTR